jgi:hypothetical protein
MSIEIIHFLFFKPFQKISIPMPTPELGLILPRALMALRTFDGFANQVPARCSIDSARGRLGTFEGDWGIKVRRGKGLGGQKGFGKIRVIRKG